MNLNRLLLVFLALCLLVPSLSFAADQAQPVEQNRIMLAKIQAGAIQEFIKNSPCKRECLEAYATKIAGAGPLAKNDGVYIADIAMVKDETGAAIEKNKVKNLATYKIQVNSNIQKYIFGAAEIEEKLFVLEFLHWSFASEQPGWNKSAAAKSYDDFLYNSNRLFFAVMDEIRSNSEGASKNFDRMNAYIKTKKVPGVYAFQPLVKSLAGEIKGEMMSAAPRQAEILKGYFEQASALLKWMGTPRVSKTAGLNVNIDSQNVSKHYDPFHPGHLHETGNGGLYHQPGDNGPFSSGSYGHGGHHNGHNQPSYPSYPTYPTQPPDYYPPQYPSYPPPSYYPPQGPTEHIHYCARCRRQFSYYPNGYAPTCPYCGYYGY